MADEPSLPKLAWDPSTGSFSHSRSRKRVRSSPPLSSDPALFSSDDDPSAENYTQERRKRKYRGPWYEQRPAETEAENASGSEPKKGKRPFERQYDSGVFMGSDGTEMDEVMEAMEDIQKSKAPSMRFRKSGPLIQLDKLLPPAEELARAQIQIYLEDGEQTIDLSSRGLSSLSNATIRPLSTFTCVAPVAEGVFSQLQPKLKIFLNANFLTTLPEELFKLESLRVLSLRANNFEELPPAIGNLRKLKELSIPQNQLRYLPFEILNLFSINGSLKTFQLHPNPFFEPQFPLGQEKPMEVQYKIGLGRGTRQRSGAVLGHHKPYEEGSRHPRWKVTYKARTAVRYFRQDGVLVQGPKFPATTEYCSPTAPKMIPVARPNEKHNPPQSLGTQHSHAPSLLEVALNACSQSPQLPNLPSALHDECPPYLVGLLTKAALKKESGGSKCTICNRNFIVPRAEWIEWWEFEKILDHKTMAGMASAASPLRQKENERDVLESMVPLMRRSCSWFCLPFRAEAKAEEVEDADGMDLD